MNKINCFTGVIFGLCMTFISCKNENNEKTNSEYKIQFELKDPLKSGFDFKNILDESKLKSPFNYINEYNGGGVGIGDIDNDGLQDIVMTGNTVASRLYRNKGDFKFEDISKKANFTFDGWATGIAMADVNNDGWIDIYICRSNDDLPANRSNLMFINNQDGTFTESAIKMGIADSNYSIGASFFDYDNDGDLDLIVANHPRFRQLFLIKHIELWQNPVKKFSSTLYRNDGGHFTDVTKEAGILSYGFCLSVSTSDYNSDGLPDIYLTVDHNEEDIFLRNNGDGTFSNVTHEALKKTPRSAMGIDVGDFNHDIHPDYMIVEMLPKEYYREKIGMGMQTVSIFNYLIDTAGYQYYQMHNFLHFNNGNGSFSDYSQLAKVHKSDWSWSINYIDADNDGWQDLFISNGYWRDIYNQDLLKPFNKQMELLNGNTSAMLAEAKKYAASCPIDPVSNFFFKNEGNLTFSDISNSVGFNKKTISTGSAYGDLDNDGDIDLVVSNIGENSFVFENKSTSGNWLRIKFNRQEGKCSMGAKVILRYNNNVQQRELLTTRGYQSSSEAIIHFGLGNVSVIDTVIVRWPDNQSQILKNVAVNQLLELDYENAKNIFVNEVGIKPLVTNLSVAKTNVDFVHNEITYDDYRDQILLPHKISEQGPFISVGDINGDGLEDFYVGAPKDQAGVIYIQQNNGSFKKSQELSMDKNYEDGGSEFCDVDLDGDLDLIVSSAGYEFEEGSSMYQARLYLNNGKGKFYRTENRLPKFPYSGSCVRTYDYDGDGDMDIFIGGLIEAKKYPKPGKSILLENDGKGFFTKVDSFEIEDIGMVKDAIWTDFNADGEIDLIVVGEWMPISFWEQKNGKFINKTVKYLGKEYRGWWNTIVSADMDGNGYNDFIVGNLGLNYKYKATDDKPFAVYGNDVDDNGSYDILLSTYYGDKVFPVRGKSCSTQQIPDLKKKFSNYHEFSISEMDDVYGDVLDYSLHYEVNTFESIIIYQESPGVFSIEKLPLHCQSSPTNGIVTQDINGDNKLDMILAGNLYQSEIETGRADNGTGRIVINKGNRKWNPLLVYESGLYIAGDVKSLTLIHLGQEKRPVMIVGNNNGPLEMVEILKK